MQLTSLTVKHVRNHTQTHWNIPSGVTLVHGPNGSGKSTLLEAIRIACLGSSWRTKQLRTLVQFEQHTMDIDLTVLHDGSESVLRCFYDAQNATTTRQRNQRPVTLQDIIGQYPLVTFTPSDNQLMAGGPRYRRTFLDQLITQRVPTYMHTLRSYKRTLQQRNHLLKQAKHTPSLAQTLDPWNEQLVSYAQEIHKKRAATSQLLASILPASYKEISNTPDNLSIAYAPNHSDHRLLEALVARTSQDIRSGQTSIGPHRDAVSLSLNGDPLSVVGSQGEQRSAVIALKHAEFMLLAQSHNTTPVVLLDDILSELDPARHIQLLTLFEEAQVLCTTTFIPSHLQQQRVTIVEVPINNILA